jgi:acetylornithine deacetylase/succinyl-diaminopimelate desuccinylase-like protein
MMATLDDVLARADLNLDSSLERLFELLRIPSISTDPHHAPECRRAAQWLVAQLTSLGFDSGLARHGRPPDGCWPPRRPERGSACAFLRPLRCSAA